MKRHLLLFVIILICTSCKKNNNIDETRIRTNESYLSRVRTPNDTVLKKIDDYFYRRLLGRWESDSIKRQAFLTELHAANEYREIDSAMAVAICAAEVTGRHGIRMHPITARLTGDNNEFWIAYCQQMHYRDGERVSNGCRDVMSNQLIYGIIGIILSRRMCPHAVRILVTVKNGLVLAIDPTYYFFDKDWYDMDGIFYRDTDEGIFW